MDIICRAAAADGFNFGDNKASRPKTEENGVAEVTLEVNSEIWSFCFIFMSSSDSALSS